MLILNTLGDKRLRKASIKGNAVRTLQRGLPRAAATSVYSMVATAETLEHPCLDVPEHFRRQALAQSVIWERRYAHSWCLPWRLPTCVNKPILIGKGQLVFNPTCLNISENFSGHALAQKVLRRLALSAGAAHHNALHSRRCQQLIAGLQAMTAVAVTAMQELDSIIRIPSAGVI